MKQPTLSLLMVTIFILLFRDTGHAQTSSASIQITKQWQSYFRQIRSIRFRAGLTILPTIGVRSEVPNGTRFSFDFAANGDNYYSHVTYPKGMEFTQLKSAFDGKDYQVLLVGKDGPTLSKTDFAPQNAYNGAEPFSILFSFAFRQGEPQTLTTLQHNHTWELLRKRIGGWSKTKQGDVDGHILTVYSDEDKGKALERWEIFIEETVGFPVQWKIYDNKNKVLKKSLKVNKTIVANSQGVRLSLPTSLTFVATGSKNGVAMSGGSQWEMEVDSLSLNRKIPSTLFRLSAPG